MKRMAMKFCIFLILLVAGPIEAKTYYDVLGINAKATASAIGAACSTKKKDIQTSLDGANKRLDAAKKEAKSRRKEIDPKLFKELNGAVRKIRTEQVLVEESCKTLQTPDERKKYDQLSPAAQRSAVTDTAALQAKAKTDVEGVALDSIQKKKAFIQKHIDRKGEFRLSKIIGDFFDTVSLTGAAKAFFRADLVVRNMKFIPAPIGLAFRDSLGFTGDMNIKGAQTRGTVYMVLDRNYKIKYSVAAALPRGEKISTLFPSFRSLDMLSLPTPELIVAGFDYLDPVTKFEVQKGLTFSSILDLAGPLSLLNDLKKKAQDFDSIIVRAEPARLYGFITSNPLKTVFGAIIPLRMGVDFTKISQIPKGFSNIFREFSTDDLSFTVALSPVVKLGMEAGVRIVLGTQTDPLRLSAFGSVTPKQVTLGMRMRGLLDLGIIALGATGIQVDIETPTVNFTLPIGCPITGLGFNGRIDLGKYSRAIFNVAGGLSFTSDALPQVVIELDAQNIRFADVIALLFKMAEKSGVKGDMPLDKIPTMTIERTRGYLALEDTTIAGKKYKAGFALQFEAQLFDKRFGFNIEIMHKELKGTGYGYLPHLDIKAGGKTVFLLSGPGIDKAGFKADDRGPAVQCTFDAKDPINSSFYIGALLEIPDMALRQIVKLVLSKKKFRAEFETKFPGFTGNFDVRLDPKRPDDFYIKFNFNQDFEKFLNQQARPALEALRQNSQKKLEDADRKIREASEELKRERQEAVRKTDAEINRTRINIRNAKNAINKTRDGCRKAPLHRKIITCTRAGKDIAREGTKLARYETYLNTVLTPGREVVRGSTGVAAQVTKKIGDAEVTKKTIQGILTGVNEALGALAKGLSIFNVKEAAGEFDTQDVIKGRTPQLVKFVAEVNIPKLPKQSISLSNLQMDFKDTPKAAENIAKALMEKAGIKF